MHTTASGVPQNSFWLMIVSMATAVLPVLRSPMISSRCPRPMGIMLSTALMPVCKGLHDRLALGDAGGDDVALAELGGLQGRAVIEGLTEGVHDAAQEGLAHGHFEQAAGRADGVAFLDREVVAVDDRADGVELEVEHLAHDRALVALELEEFAGHGLGEAVNAGDAVTDFDDAADLGDFELRGKLGNSCLMMEAISSVRIFTGACS